jgi:glycosyltransferase involved in cell wall biosynthesis
MSVIHALRTWVRVGRAEGAAAVRDRVLDRWSETRRRGPFDAAPPRGDASAAPVLNVIGVEMAARLGGVPLQLRARLRHESLARPIALLARQANGDFLLEQWNGQRWQRRAFASGGGWNGDPLSDEPGWIDSVRTASRLVGARAVHVENLAGLSLASLTHLAAPDLPTVVSLHDFSAFCRRPNLWQSSGGFCHYSCDNERCGRCLAASAAPLAIDQPRHRALAVQALAAATALIFPSSFLRTRLAQLVPWGDGPTCDVVSPGAAGARQAIRRPGEVAFIGGGADHKGGARLPALARALVARGAAVTVYGGNGDDNLRALRQIPRVRVRGYFRAGMLPSLLARQGAAVALLLPGVPESFSLGLSEAWAAGVPVVAPAHGALRERLERGGGTLLSAEPSDEEIVAAIDRVRQAPVSAIPLPPTASDAARRHLEIYRRCGFASV